MGNGRPVLPTVARLRYEFTVDDTPRDVGTPEQHRCSNPEQAHEVSHERVNDPSGIGWVP